MKRLLNLCFVLLIAGALLLIFILYSTYFIRAERKAQQWEQFNKCTELLGGHSDANCAACEYLLPPSK